MAPTNILITGCNRGIGLELVKQYLKASPPPKNIFATCRNPSKASELAELAKANSNLHILTLEVTKYDTYDKIVNEVKKVVKDDGLNLVINNAGILPNEITEATTPEMMLEAFEVNAVAPLFFSKALLPLVKQAVTKNANKSFGVDKAAIVMMSSSIGSIAENNSGGVTAYRCSKTALNMAMKNLSLELKADKILVMAMHPGWVQTSLGGPRAQISTEECCTKMLKTLAGLGEKDIGTLLRYNNTPIPW